MISAKDKSWPLVTVVTVVFNGEDVLEETIRSVLTQNYPNVEYIIIDGASADETIGIIRKYESRISCWISEKDDGIYDAMNKGLSLAHGEWINFMNAGDIFHTPNVLMEVMNANLEHVDIVYGDVHIRYPDFSRVERAGEPRYLWKGMQFCHQSVLVRLASHRRYPFDINNRIAADLGFFYTAYRNGMHFKYMPVIISSVITGGVSESNRTRAILASMNAVCGTAFEPGMRLYYYWRCMDARFRGLAKALLPKWLVRKIIQFK